jgi:hypothetical protein
MADNKNRENKIVFALSPAHGDTMATLLLGIPAGAWGYMKDGHTHTFDLTNAGLPMGLILYGAATHQEAIDMLTAGMQVDSVPYEMRMDQDFSIKDKDGDNI